MWGIPINMESSDTSETAKADVILLKFLTPKYSRVQDAYDMLIKSLEWRKAYGADSIVEQDLGFKTLENRVCYNMGCDRQGRSVSYTNYSNFYEQTSLYEEIFSIYENQKKFIRWRIQVIERLIRMLSFKPGEVNSIVLVQDFKHRFSRPLIDVDEKIFSILRDNYPGMISYKVVS
ncbi:patellin-6 [Tanacetum coccineum]